MYCKNKINSISVENMQLYYYFNRIYSNYNISSEVLSVKLELNTNEVKTNMLQ